MSIQWYVGRILLGIGVVAAVGCDNAKPLIDAADVKVDKLTQNGTFLRVDGSNLSWFQSAKIENASGQQIDAPISLKMDDYLILSVTSSFGTASGGGSLTLGNSYVIVLDAGLKEPFRSEAIILSGGAIPSITFQQAQYFLNTTGLLNIGGICSIDGLPVNITLSQIGQTNQSFVAMCSGGMWSSTTNVYNFNDGAFNIEVGFTDGSTNATASASGIRDTSLPSFNLTSGSEVGTSNVTSLPIQFTISDANLVDVHYDVIAGSSCPSVLAHLSGGPSGAYSPGNLDISSLPDGQVTLCFNLKDAAGNSVSEHFSWTKDATTPNIIAMSVVDPDAPAPYGNGANGLQLLLTLASSETVTLEFFESSDCSANQNFTGSFSGPSITRNFDMNIGGNGTHDFSVRAVDAAGNSSGCQTRSMVFDMTPPTIGTYVLNDGDSISAKAVIPYAITAADSGTGIKSVSFFRTADCTGALVYGNPSLTGSFQHFFSAGSSGTLSAKVEDHAGNFACQSRPFTYALEVETKYSASRYFNEWLKISNPAQACDPSSMADCVWAGAFRKVVTAESSCTSLSISELPAGNDFFDWICDDSTSTAIFYGKLKGSIGLHNLIESDGGGGFRWNKKSVQISGPLLTGASTALAEAWWSGSVNPLANNTSTLTTLAEEGAVYVVPVGTTVETRGIVLAAPKISIVSEDAGVGTPTAKLHASSLLYNSGFYTMITVSAPFSYVDVPMESNHLGSYLVRVSNAGLARIRIAKGISNGSGIYMYAAHGSSLKNSYLKGNSADGVGLNITGTGTNDILVSDVQIEKFSDGVSLSQLNNGVIRSLLSTDNAGYGIRLSYMVNAKISEVRSFDNGARGIDDVYCSGSTLQNIVSASNNGEGIHSEHANACILQNVLASKNVGDGIYVDNAANVLMLNVAGMQNQYAGVYYGANTTGTYLIRAASYNNAAYQYYFNSPVSTYEQPFYYGGSGDCAGANCPPGGYMINPGGAPSIVGMGDYSTYTSFIEDGFMTGSWLQTIGEIVSLYGPCTFQPNCRMTNWNVLTGDVALLNRGPSVGLGPVNASVACPAYLAGGQSVTLNGQTFLLHAMEIMNPKSPYYRATNAGVNDHDGLCESGEACLALPNLGPYQGHGALSQCVFQDGSVSNVSMYGYQNNGLTNGAQVIPAPLAL